MSEAYQFVHRLKAMPENHAAFNPWWERDIENDIGPSAPRIRRRQLEAYLAVRVSRARIVVVGEALGYQGGHFTGIAMTSERILLGHKSEAGVGPAQIIPGLNPRRTSKPERIARGFSEPTATIVWQTLLSLGVKADRFVLWNAFPWHPFDKRRGLLSNRTPTREELQGCVDVLADFLAMFEFEAVLALGVLAMQQLHRAGCAAIPVRHPASAGAREFRQQLPEFLRERLASPAS